MSGVAIRRCVQPGGRPSTFFAPWSRGKPEDDRRREDYAFVRARGDEYQECRNRGIEAIDLLAQARPKSFAFQNSLLKHATVAQRG